MRRIFFFTAFSGFMACSSVEHDTNASNETADAGASSLKHFMSANASPALKTSNFEKLDSVFRNVKSYAPQDASFASWSTIAADGAAAAKNKDLEGVREACQACHTTHRAAYREAVRGR